MNRSLWILILNWNGLDDTLECVRSIEANHSPSVQIVVIDNGSEPSETRHLAEESRNNTRYVYLQTSKNLGFAGGNNVGIRYALVKGAEAILLLNNDTAVEADFCEHIMQGLRREPNVSLFGVTVYYYNSCRLYACGGGKTEFWKDDFSLIGRHALACPSNLAGLGYIAGCSLLVRRIVFEKIGLFDERFFLYSEETDFCLRARETGYRLGYIREAIVRHKVARSTRHLSSQYIYYMVRNKLLLARLHCSWNSWFSFAPIFVVKEIGGYTLAAVLNRNVRALRAPWLAAVDFLRQRFGRRDL